RVLFRSTDVQNGPLGSFSFDGFIFFIFYSRWVGLHLSERLGWLFGHFYDLSFQLEGEREHALNDTITEEISTEIKGLSHSKMVNTLREFTGGKKQWQSNCRAPGNVWDLSFEF